MPENSGRNASLLTEVRGRGWSAQMDLLPSHVGEKKEKSGNQKPVLTIWSL